MDENYDLLSKEALNYSMEMIKNDLKKLGVSHDNFVSEKSIVEKNVESAIKKLKKQNMLKKDFWIHPKGEENKKLEENKKINF